MKKFNQMTERQMSKIDGGIPTVVLVFTGLFTGGIGGAGVAAGIANEQQKS